MEYQLRLRVDPPVCNVEMHPHTYFDGDESSFTLQFTWFRSSRRRVCSRKGCLNLYSHNSAGQQPVQCLSCLAAQCPVDEACYCSVECFKGSWAVHSLNHNKPMQGRPSTDKQDMVLRQMQAGAQSNEEADSWIMCCQNKVYVPPETDVGRVLLLQVTAVGSEGQLSVSHEMAAVLPGPVLPPIREFVASNSLKLSPDFVANRQPFRLMTYNILAEIYATQQVYPYCPMWCLNWNYRRQLIMREIRHANADVLCLQEVQQDSWTDFWLPTMSSLGYHGFFKAKTREAMGSQGKIDGCGFFYRESRFELVERHDVEFNTIALSMAQDPNLVRRLMKDNVAQVVVLRIKGLESKRGKEEDNCIAVCNTHIFSNPKFADIKLWQTFVLLKELEKLIYSRNLPILLCGDFNSDPDSAVYKLLSRQRIPQSSVDDPAHILPEDMAQLTHSLPLHSAYLQVLGREPDYTNYTGTSRYLWRPGLSELV